MGLEEGVWIGRYDWCGVSNVDVLSREEEEYEEPQSMWVFSGVGNDQLMSAPSMDRRDIWECGVGEVMEWECVVVHGGGLEVGYRRPWWRHIGLSGGVV